MPNDKVGDPFLGSGTSGVEALRSSRSFWGCDVNPVATLISQAKCTSLEPGRLKYETDKLEEKLGCIPTPGRRQLTKTEIRRIKEIDIARASKEDRLHYWFPLKYQSTLLAILEEISSIQEPELQTHYLCAFSNILRSSSIWLSGSTKPQKDLEKFLSDPIDRFRKQIRSMVKRNILYWESLDAPHGIQSRFELEVQDARALSNEGSSVDLIVSSPPYATCYQYAEIHQLTQLWLEKHELLPEADIRTSCIGAKRVSNRGKPQENSTAQISSSSANNCLETLLELGSQLPQKRSAINREVKALRHYFADMNMAIHECGRILKSGKYLILIVGDSKKRGIAIPTSDALVENAEQVGLCLERKISRRIPARVLVSTRDEATGKFSSRASSNTQAYAEENILVLRKVGRSEHNE